jgi:hypothetical protein
VYAPRHGTNRPAVVSIGITVSPLTVRYTVYMLEPTQGLQDHARAKASTTWLLEPRPPRGGHRHQPQLIGGLLHEQLHLRLDPALVGAAELLLRAAEGELDGLLIEAGACRRRAAPCGRGAPPLREGPEPVVREGLEDAQQRGGALLALELAQRRLAVRAQVVARAARPKRVLRRGGGWGPAAEGARGARLGPVAEGGGARGARQGSASGRGVRC